VRSSSKSKTMRWAIPATSNIRHSSSMLTVSASVACAVRLTHPLAVHRQLDFHALQVGQ
jgi:hypothetical protein